VAAFMDASGLLSSVRLGLAAAESGRPGARAFSVDE